MPRPQELQQAESSGTAAARRMQSDASAEQAAQAVERVDLSAFSQSLGRMQSNFGPQIDPTYILSQHVRGQFLAMYMPADASDHGLAAWLPLAMEASRPGMALDFAWDAVCWNRVGWQTGDDALTRKSRNMYGEALRRMQQALWDENVVKRDETLAACRVLAMYEVGS